MIRFAKEKDIPNIMRFIDEYWKKGHILSTNQDFFKYEHLLPEGVSYVISEDENSSLNAILGYIPYGSKNRDVMTVMWKANPTAEPSLGLKLLKYLKDYANVRIMASPGSNKKLKGLYQYLGYSFGKMIQWYRLGEKMDYTIAKITNNNRPNPPKENYNYFRLDTWDMFEELFDFEKYQNSNPKPYKEKWYIRKRYFNHPIYKYEIFALKSSLGYCNLVLFFRKINIEKNSVLRLIDCIGDFNELQFATEMIDDLLFEFGAEYVDFYEYGISDQVLKKAGWLKVEGSGNIIPNYFSPFEQKNIDIYYFSTDPEIVLFKGDGDQDRPN